jgi:hypothetical protein
VVSYELVGLWDPWRSCGPHSYDVRSREILTWAQTQQVSFEHTYIILKNLIIKELINDN